MDCESYNTLLFEKTHGPVVAPSARLLQRIQWIADRIPSRVTTVLDVGSGRCWVSNLLMERGYQVTSLDLVLTSLKKSKAGRVQGSGARLPFKRDSFDLVLCAEVLEHLQEGLRRDCLAEMWRVSRRYVLLTVPKEEHLTGALVRCNRCRGVFHAYGHVASFDMETVRELLPLPPVVTDTLLRRVRRYANPLRAVRHHLLGTYGYDDDLVCPRCGNPDIAPPRRTFPVKVLDRLNRVLGLEGEQGWILAVYDKRSVGLVRPVGEYGGAAQRRRFRRVVAGLDRTFTSLGLAGGRLRRRHAWRAGRWIQAATAVGHEALLRAIIRYRWSPIDEDMVRAVQHRTTKEAPRYPYLWLTGGKPTERAEALRQDDREWTVTAIQAEEPISWTQASDGRSWLARWHFNSLGHVAELLDAHRRTLNEGSLDRAKALAGRWIHECYALERSEEVWGDHGTALRAIVLCQLWHACERVEPMGSPFMDRLLRAIARHAQKLAHERFYRADHNHGVTQAFALLVIGLMFPLLPEGRRWAEQGRQRLEAQMGENVSVEGLHREHSPFYHFYVFRQFLYAWLFAGAYDAPLSQGFTERLGFMLRSGAHFLKPDGTLAALGDTYRGAPPLVERHDLDVLPWTSASGFLYSQTRGTEGAPPPERSCLFPGAGYAILRSGWGEGASSEEERALVLRLSTFRTSHIHRDVFTFEMFAYGDDLIVDAGGPYKYGDPLRADFFLSTRAHNTVVVDDRDQAVGEARILRWAPSGECEVLLAEHENYSGVVHRRAVLFVRRRYFIVFDRLVSGQSHRYSQLFHLNPRLEARVQRLTVGTVNPAGGPTVQIIPLVEDALGLQIHRGLRSPTQGWVCVGEAQMVPNVVIEYQRMGTDVTFGTLLLPEAGGQSIPCRASLEGRPLEGQALLRVELPGWRDEILLSPEGDVTIRGR